MHRGLSSSTIAHSKRFVVCLFPVAVNSVKGYDAVPKHSPNGQFVWIGKSVRTSEELVQHANAEVQVSRFVLWMHEKAAQGNTMIQTFADSTADKSKVAWWK
jgi:hypothetical protein